MKNNLYKSKRALTSILIVILGIIGGAIWIHVSLYNDKIDVAESTDMVEKLFFFSGFDQPKDLLMSNPDGSFITFIAKATGSLDATEDGMKLAAGCENPEKICVYDLTKIPNYQPFPADTHNEFYDPQVINISLECDSEALAEFGIPSLSWSWNGDRLAYTCKENMTEDYKLCLHSFKDGITECVDGEVNGYGEILFLSYSPVEDLLLVGVGTPSKLMIINESIQVIEVLGWADEGAWSPDGERIAFDKDANPDGSDGSWGYALINKDGTGFRWIFPKERQFTLNAEFDDSCFELSNHCGMSWSNDGEEIFFGAAISSPYFHHILKYNFITDQITCLTKRGFGERNHYSLPIFVGISEN